MPVTVKEADEGLGFIMKGEGAITGQEILNCIAQRFSSEDQTRRYVYGMSDYTSVTKIEMSTDEVKLVAEKDMHAASINPDLLIAIAAPQDAMFGLSRMFEGYAVETGWDINVFRAIDEAQKSIIAKLKEKNFQTNRINFEECE